MILPSPPSAAELVFLFRSSLLFPKLAKGRRKGEEVPYLTKELGLPIKEGSLDLAILSYFES